MIATGACQQPRHASPGLVSWIHSSLNRGSTINFNSIARSAAFLGAIALSGCVTTNASVLGTASASRPVVLPANVYLYRTAEQVPRRYEEIALLNSAGDSAFTDEAKMFTSMRKKAGELGANGVILDAVSEPSAGAKVAGAIFGVSAQRKGKALAIYVFPSEAPQP